MSIDVTFFSIASATFKSSVPLIFAALGGMFAERSGIADIALEGKMLGAAFAGAAVTSLTGSPFVGVAMAVATSVGLALVQGFASITCRGNQTVAGVAINFVASGLTATVGLALFNQGGQTQALSSPERFLPIRLPYHDQVAGIPILGPFYSTFLSSQDLFFYLMLLGLVVTGVVLDRTDFGLALRGAGENPEAVDAAGRSVSAIRYLALAITGAFCGFAGSTVSMAQMSLFLPDMTAGQGYLALTALIFGRWRPFPVFCVCLMFGLLNTLQDRIQGNPFPVLGAIPAQLFSALPYVMTLILLASMRSGAIGPRAIGRPFARHG